MPPPARKSSRSRRPAVRHKRSSGKRRRTRKPRINWQRFGRVVLVVAIAGVLVSYIQPISSYWTQRQADQRATVQLNEFRQQNRDLKQRVKALNDSRTFETQARRMGMVRPGERLFIIEGLERR